MRRTGTYWLQPQTSSGNPIVSHAVVGRQRARSSSSVPSLAHHGADVSPAPGPNPDITDSDDYEYIELKNVGTTTLNLTDTNSSMASNSTSPAAR
jgi:hypothetical protein